MLDWLVNWFDHVVRAGTSAAQWNQLGPSIIGGAIAALVAVYVAKYTVEASTRAQDRAAANRAEDEALRRVSESLYEMLTGMDDIAACEVSTRPTRYLRFAKKIHMAVVIEAPTVQEPMREQLVRLRRAAIRLFVAWHLESDRSMSAAGAQQTWRKYRRLLDRLALGANWQIGQWRAHREAPSSVMFDDIDEVLNEQALPDTNRQDNDVVQEHLLGVRAGR